MGFFYFMVYRVIPGHTNWQIETAVWNLAGFLHHALETCWQRFGQFLDDFLYENLTFPYKKIFFMKNLNDFLYDFLNDS